MKKLFLVLPLVAALATIGVVAGIYGCDDTEALIDCHSICEDWEDCAGDQFDVSACTARCEDVEDIHGEAGEARIEACNECLDDNEETACREPFPCAAACTGIPIVVAP